MPEPVLEIRGLRKRFGALVATDDVSLTLMPGEIHALIGPNGAGKSTLIGQITGEVRPDAGSIRFAGREIVGLGPVGCSLAGLGRSFQVSAVMPEFTALQNVMLAVQGASGRSFRFFRPALSDRGLTEPAHARLAAVGLAGRGRVLAAELSHGERRQLEIAMALALEPKAFLLDEPMAGLGPEGSKALTGFLDGLRRTAPILLVEHDMDAVFALADRISVLVYGRVVASGTPDAIAADPVVREAYLGDAA